MTHMYYTSSMVVCTMLLTALPLVYCKLCQVWQKSADKICTKRNSLGCEMQLIYGLLLLSIYAISFLLNLLCIYILNYILAELILIVHSGF